MSKLDLEKPEEPKIKLPKSGGSQRKQGNSRKTSTYAPLTTEKTLTVWITTNYGKFLKRGEYQTILPVSWESCMQNKKQGLESNGRKQRGTKEPLDEGQREEWKNWLKTQHPKNKRSWYPVPSLPGKQMEKSGNSDRLYFLGLQNHCGWGLQPGN